MYEIGTKIFENWEIIRKIGEGSFGAVYELHREDFGETYRSALKVIRVPQNDSEIQSLKEEGMSERDIQRYLYGSVTELVREFAIMAKLKATGHIVSYEDHTVIRHSDGIGWDILIRMELLNPLLNYAYEHPFTRKAIIQLGIDICKALELCQKYNIIHRDIKPDNIFVTDDGAFKLGDFGIARTIEKTMSGLSKKGTYSYMAPEVYKGEEYGFCVDTYSLGIVLYRLLNRNRTPFLPAPPQPITVNSREMALVKRMSGEKLPMPYYGHGRLGEIVLKACAYDPSKRYSSPAQMRQELEAILYNSSDAQLIYPSGDEIRIIKNEYLPCSNGSKTSRETAGQEDTLLQSISETASDGSVYAARQKDRTRGGKYAANNKMPPNNRVPKARKRKKRVWIWVLAVFAILTICAAGIGIGTARLTGARDAKQQQYTRYMEEAQRCRDSDPDKAMELYLSAQEMFPELEVPYIAYAYTLYSSRQYESCIVYIEDDLALGKRFSEDGQNQLCEILGAAYFELDDYAAAASFFRLSTAGGSITVPAMRDYAVSLGRFGDIQAADEVMTKMKEAGASGAVMTYVQAEIDFALENYLLAEEGFSGALRAAGESDLQRRALKSLAALYRDCSALEKTGYSPVQDPAQKEVELLEQGLQEYNLQYDSTLQEMLAMAYYEAYNSSEGASQEYLTKSADYFQRVIDMGIQKDYLYRNLYTIYYELGDYEKAEYHLEKYETAFPNDYMPHALRAIMLITIENEKDPSERNYTSAVSEYETAGRMIRSSDDQVYYQQIEGLIAQLKANNWLA